MANAPARFDAMGKVPMEDVADILNTINDALEKMGYVAVGYDNTGILLDVLIDRKERDDDD